jgi:hypothetical protein
MKTLLTFVLVLALAPAYALSAQKGEQGGGKQRANQGRVPPAPTARGNPRAAPMPERGPAGRINNTPHVNNNRWYGHAAPSDPRLRLAHPFEHGRFQRYGPSYRYNIVRIDMGRRFFWFPGGFYFQIAAWDWPLCTDWCWTCPAIYVVYLDPDHPGWYLLYNMQTGVYVHVLYMGM